MPKVFHWRKVVSDTFLALLEAKGKKRLGLMALAVILLVVALVSVPGPSGKGGSLQIVTTIRDSMMSLINFGSMSIEHRSGEKSDAKPADSKTGVTKK